MATYELYQGGSRQQNNNWAMFPAATFAASAPVDPAIKQIPASFFVSRTLDFSNDTALADYVSQLVTAGTPIASGDKAGAVVIPTEFLTVGFYWRVDRINAGGTFSVATRVGAVTLLAGPQSTGTLASGYVTWPSGPVLFSTSDIIDVDFVTVPAGGVGPLSLTVGFHGIHFRHGN
jgi:hypothetical protein